MTLTNLSHTPSKLLPVLRSIAREIRERTVAIRSLEARRGSFSKSAIHAVDRANADAELAIQRRELRHAEHELERLGCRLDDREPLRIAVLDEGRSYTFSWNLEQTQFHDLPLADAAETAS